jgi:hypothetical protein
VQQWRKQSRQKNCCKTDYEKWAHQNCVVVGRILNQTTAHKGWQEEPDVNTNRIFGFVRGAGAHFRKLQTKRKMAAAPRRKERTSGTMALPRFGLIGK